MTCIYLFFCCLALTYAPISSFAYYYDNRDCRGEADLINTYGSSFEVVNGACGPSCLQNIQCENPTDPACRPQYYQAKLVKIQTEPSYYLVNVNGASVRHSYHECVASRVYEHCYFKIKPVSCTCLDEQANSTLTTE